MFIACMTAGLFDQFSARHLRLGNIITCILHQICVDAAQAARREGRSRLSTLPAALRGSAASASPWRLSRRRFDKNSSAEASEPWKPKAED